MALVYEQVSLPLQRLYHQKYLVATKPTGQKNWGEVYPEKLEIVSTFQVYYAESTGWLVAQGGCTGREVQYLTIHSIAAQEAVHVALKLYREEYLPKVIEITKEEGMTTRKDWEAHIEAMGLKTEVTP